MRMRSAAAAGLTAVALAACGGGSDASAVRQTAHDFVNDLLSGNAAGACALFTPQALSSAGGVSGCLRVIGAVAGVPRFRSRLQQQSDRIDKAPVTIHGDSATISVAGGSPTQLVKRNGKWLINGGLSSSG